MPLTHTKDLFAKALKGKYALGAFNVNNMELIQAIVEACEEEKAPLILQISKGARSYANPVYLKKLIEAAVSVSNVPIAVHLDHGDTFELCKQCIDEGFTSVMIDASHEPFEKNAEITRKVVEYAHKYNASVESELGHLVGAQFDEGEEGGAHSTSGHYTNPDEAVKFVKETGCDSLAVAIGNSHGAFKFKGEQHLDLERLKAIKKALLEANLGDYPLVLHGASSVPKYLVDEINKYGGKMPDAQGVPEADIEIARRVGCTKVNIDTDLRMAMTAGIRKVLRKARKNSIRANTWAPPAPTSKTSSATRSRTCSAAPATRSTKIISDSRPRLATAWGFLFFISTVGFRQDDGGHIGRRAISRMGFSLFAWFVWFAVQKRRRAAAVQDAVAPTNVP